MNPRMEPFLCWRVVHSMPLLLLLLEFWHCRLDSSSVFDDRHNFAGRRHLVSLLSWLDFCDQLIANANPIISRSVAVHIRQRLMDECIEPAIMQTYAAVAFSSHYMVKPSGCWSTPPHAVVLTLMREHYHCVYLYMLCCLMYWRMLLIYTKQLPVSELWVHDV